MPVTSPISRRSFLTKSVVIAGFGFSYQTWAGAQAAGDSDRVILLSDTHIAADPERVLRGVKMADNLNRVVAEVKASMGERKAKALCITGDIAVNDGQEGDYREMKRLLQPLDETGVPRHLLMGNHDHREHCTNILGKYQPQGLELAPHVASKISLVNVNLFLLDTLTRTNHTPGELGAAQMAWLEKELVADAAKPAVLLFHHNVRFDDPKNALTDSEALFAVMKKYPQLKAAFFGHSHRWEIVEKDGKQLVNLPPTAYVFKEGLPNGWVDAEFHTDRVELTLHSLDKGHPLSGSRQILKWS
ncbi:MAG: metallophosphoesterase [Akkermansiaceae bacterium]|nr:metallophosphoesterase [Akkermansiaceae bacterium]